MNLRTLITLVAAAVMLVGFLCLGIVIRTSLKEYTAATAIRAVEVRAEALSTFLGRALKEEWQRVRLAAARFSPPRDGDLTPFIQSLATDIDKDGWIGIASAGGTVLAATESVLVGEDVSQHPWFREGLRAPFAGDVHEAVLLVRQLAANRTEPLRFVDFSAPLLRADGSRFGVLGVSVDWRWIRALVKETAQVLGLDVFVINRAGTVILATTAAIESLPDLGSFQSVQLGRTVTGTETWPDGEEYFVATVPDMTSGAMPPLGWGLVARLDSTFVTEAENQFLWRVAGGGIAVLAVSIVSFALIASALLRPLRTLSQAVLATARGQDTQFVREHRRFEEATLLSNAVSLLQSGRSAHPQEER